MEMSGKTRQHSKCCGRTSLWANNKGHRQNAANNAQDVGPSHNPEQSDKGQHTAQPPITDVKHMIRQAGPKNTAMVFRDTLVLRKAVSHVDVVVKAAAQQGGGHTGSDVDRSIKRQLQERQQQWHWAHPVSTSGQAAHMVAPTDRH